MALTVNLGPETRCNGIVATLFEYVIGNETDVILAWRDVSGGMMQARCRWADNLDSRGYVTWSPGDATDIYVRLAESDEYYLIPVDAITRITTIGEDS